MAKLLARALDALDGARTRTSQPAPTPREEGTHFPAAPWDLRTIIAVPPPGSPLRYLNVNTVLGLTGTDYDRAPDGARARDLFDLQLGLDIGGRSMGERRVFAISRDLDFRRGATTLRTGDRLDYEGRWPDYRCRATLPEQALELELELSSLPGIAWWARFPGLYRHYTSFCRCTLRWTLAGERGEAVAGAVHEHGWGRRSPLPGALVHFRYEVLTLPDGGWLLVLLTEGPRGAVLRSRGLLRRGRPDALPEPLDLRSYGITASDGVANHAGLPRRVARHWAARLKGGPDPTIEYEAERTTEPLPVMGDGFLQGFDYEARLPSGTLRGRGYAEQMGRARGAEESRK